MSCLRDGLSGCPPNAVSSEAHCQLTWAAMAHLHVQEYSSALNVDTVHDTELVCFVWGLQHVSLSGRAGDQGSTAASRFGNCTAINTATSLSSRTQQTVHLASGRTGKRWWTARCMVMQTVSHLSNYLHPSLVAHDNLCCCHAWVIQRVRTSSPAHLTQLSGAAWARMGEGAPTHTARMCGWRMYASTCQQTPPRSGQRGRFHGGAALGSRPRSCAATDWNAGRIMARVMTFRGRPAR